MLFWWDLVGGGGQAPHRPRPPPAPALLSCLRHRYTREAQAAHPRITQTHGRSQGTGLNIMGAPKQGSVHAGEGSLHDAAAALAGSGANSGGSLSPGRLGAPRSPTRLNRTST